jgi:hypothetical protein
MFIRDVTLGEPPAVAEAQAAGAYELLLESAFGRRPIDSDRPSRSG